MKLYKSAEEYKDFIREHFEFPQERPVIIFETKARQMLLHTHDCLEINLILAGSGTYIIGDKQYEIQEGDFFIINNEERHMAVHNGELRILVLIFPPLFLWEGKSESGLLEPFFNRNQKFSNRIMSSASVSAVLREYLMHVHQEYSEEKKGWQIYAKAYILLLLAEIVRYCEENEEIGGEVKNMHKLYTRIRPVVDYLHANYSNQITLEELAEVAHMNKSYLCTSFKDAMSMPIFSYIDQLRISRACALLRTTDFSVTEISMQVGYNSISYFNRSFKKVKSLTPGQYRRFQS